MYNVLRFGPDNAPLLTLQGEKVEQVSGVAAVDLVSNGLSIDSMDATVRYRYVAPSTFAPKGYDIIRCSDGRYFLCAGSGVALNKLSYGTRMVWEHARDGRRRNLYVENVSRSSPDGWAIHAVSLVGLLDNIDHVGGVYTGQRFDTVLAGIVGGAVGAAEADGTVTVSNRFEPIRISGEVAETKIYGYLPYASCRSNLHQLLFATGASLTRDAAGQITICFLQDTGLAGIVSDMIFAGGSVRYDAEATAVAVTEHVYQWAYTTAEKTLYDNTAAYAEAADHVLVKFSDPVRVSTLRAEGSIAVHEQGQNYAIISGKGKLCGVPYTHITRVLTQSAETDAPGRVRQINSCTLVSPLNSENVLRRAYAFCTMAQKITAEITVTNERPGGFYQFVNAVGQSTRGVLQSMSYAESALTRAECSFVSRPQAGPFGNNYNNSAFFTGSGSWIVPQSVRQSAFPFIRLSLFGGGNGGDGGNGGRAGRGCYLDAATDKIVGRGGGKGGKGGAGGIGGLAGKVLSIARLNVQNVARIDYTCGGNGTGGVRGLGGHSGVDPTEPGPGGIGGETELRLYDDGGGLIATYSSVNGVLLPSGVIDLTTDTVYALNGRTGVAGGDGGEGGASAFGSDGMDGQDVSVNGVIYKGGEGSRAFDGYITYTQLVAMCGGGGGGGAAAGADGGVTPPGTAPYLGGHAYAQANAGVWGGTGGAGANAAITPAAPQIAGQGGDGGNGGGGGGSGGAQNHTDFYSGGFSTAVRDGTEGVGGDGTNGAPGGAGAWFCYY